MEGRNRTTGGGAWLMSLFTAEKIQKVFGEKDNSITVLKDVSLIIEPGEMTAIIGASGSGKTTLLQILGTLALPSSGTLSYKGVELTKQKDGELAAFRNRAIGFIFQFHHLLADFTTLENVMMPAFIAGNRSRQIKVKAEDLLKQVELGHRLQHRVYELSGGEQQRTALARALIMDPEILLADEPTGNLDSRAGNLVFDLLQKLSRQRNLSTVMVTHNNQLAKKMDHCLQLKDGVLGKIV